MRLAVVGAGLKAVEYVESWLKLDDVEIVAVADVSELARTTFGKIFVDAGLPAPRSYARLEDLLADCSDDIDAAYVATPHAFHAEGAIRILEHGLDLLLEKPMVTTVQDAKRLLHARDKVSAHVIIAYQGALSPLVQDTIQRAESGEFGELVSISATIWEDWSERYDGQWKQKPEISGGGFMFDTGAHMLNTVCMLSGSEFHRVCAFMANRGKAVDIVTSVNAQLKSGALVTFNATGVGPQSCDSFIKVFYEKAIVTIDAWGKWRQISTGTAEQPRETVEVTDNPLLTFIDICESGTANPSSVENGIRFAHLWDAIKESARLDGCVVDIDN